ncbi:signal transduction diguanylate cyclase/phosphodiesterase [Oleiphilus messinensis]|uniref:Signal transduction diguanylate cyclase/phosphodiesterase n=1 Tax=Oleiphilus messinensis TaxID=141451 RepID=A0A1Y0I2A6_9GAMM|nr:EAL domain-containing protein [Oleiphilus messinensis]ARU54531.1 signal transduction diguanylate cyclase/phosphodiesterase [Oleiphilus messinensis]
MSLKLKYTLALLILAVISISLFSWVSRHKMDEVLRQETFNRIADTLTLIQTSFAQTLSSASANLVLYSQDTSLQRYLLNGAELDRRLVLQNWQQILEQFPEYQELVLINADKYESVRMVQTAVPNKHPEDYSRLLDLARAHPGTSIHEIVYHEDFQTYSLVIYRALSSSALLKHAPVLRLSVNLNWIQDIMSEPPFSQDTYVFLVESHLGEVMSDPRQRDAILFLMSSSYGSVAEFSRHKPARRQLQVADQRYFLDHRPLINRWQLYISVPNHAISSRYDVFAIELILVIAITGISIGLILYLLFNRLVLIPLNALTSQTNRVLDDSAELIELVPRRDEIGHLQDAFVELRQKVRQNTRDLQVQATTDSLTGLPNRLALMDILQSAIHVPKGIRSRLALMFIDLDGFKQVNDVMGHETGDLLLKEVTQRLLCIKTAHQPPRLLSVARLGGDEFTVVLELQDETLADEVTTIAHVADSIIDQLRSGFLLEEREAFVGASVGIALYPDDADNIPDLLKYADIAMYEAKSLGKMRYEFFQPKMAASQKAQLDLENVISHALEHDEFEVVFQPKIDIKGGKVAGFEALARLNSSKMGWVGPHEFIPAAEEKGLIDYITLLVCERSCAFINAMGEVPDDFKISINISPIQIADSRLFRELQSMISKAEVPYKHIEYEVTENSLIKNEEKSRRQLDIQRSLGFSTALDDFGVGYSSLGHLKRFSFCTLKIDRIFVDDVHHDGVSKVILKAIIEMANSLNMTVVAEGVETVDQLDTMLDLGIDHVQGYLFSKPLAAQVALDFLAHFAYPSELQALGASAHR